MKNKFLFELGTEEIPAGMVPPATAELETLFEEHLEEAQLDYSAMRLFSTPRRLALKVEGLPDRQPDREEEVSGPPKAVAFTESGEPTRAAEGFARKMGVEVSDLRVVETEKGAYVTVLRKINGEPTPEILKQVIPKVISEITWPKSMYWTSSRFRFIRPLRWFVSLWNSDLIPFEFEGISAGRTTRGHRLLGSSSIELESVDEYEESLRKNFVIVDPAERLQRIVSGIEKETTPYRLRSDDDLLNMVVHLNEFPTALRGGFDGDFLSMPREVLVTVMRFHQKYFSVEEEGGELAPYFLTIVNTNEDPDGNIQQGHEKVLQARLEDAAFFWRNDQETPLRDRVESLGHVLFQDRLGTYLDKTRRVQKVCERLKDDPDLKTAALLAKTDLTTEMVREFPELQGNMGGLYAEKEGYPEAVWTAIYDQYLPVSLEDDSPRNETGILLSLADRLDTIVGCFGIDIKPTGSSDPFALRRQAQGLIALLLRHRLNYPVSTLIEIALENFDDSEGCEETASQVASFLEQRLASLLQREGFPQDVIRAVFAVGMTTAHEAADRVKALAEIKGEPDIEALAISFKRIRNILSKAVDGLGTVDPELFQDPAEEKLFSAYNDLKPVVVESLETGDHGRALTKIAAVRPVVDLFFDEVLVMDEDEVLRRNRLALLNEISDVFLLIADISEIVQAGGENEQ